MTVKELRDALAGFPPDAEIHLDIAVEDDERIVVGCEKVTEQPGENAVALHGARI